MLNNWRRSRISLPTRSESAFHLGRDGSQSRPPDKKYWDETSSSLPDTPDGSESRPYLFILLLH
jgi:hypothetical protein